MLEEALLCCSNYKESSPSLLELERVPDMLYETPKVFPDTRSHPRGMLSFPTQVKKSLVIPCPLRLERNADVPVAPLEEAGIYLTLEGNPGPLS